MSQDKDPPEPSDVHAVVTAAMRASDGPFDAMIVCVIAAIAFAKTLANTRGILDQAIERMWPMVTAETVKADGAGFVEVTGTSHRIRPPRPD